MYNTMCMSQCVCICIRYIYAYIYIHIICSIFYNMRCKYYVYIYILRDPFCTFTIVHIIYK